MSELTFLVFRIGLLLLMWFFLLGVIYALKSDLFGAPARRGKKAKVNGPLIAAPMIQQPVVSTPVVSSAPVISPEGPTVATPVITPDPIPVKSDAINTLVITDGVAAGTAITLDDDVLTIGRSPDSSLVIVDEYTSTHHAKLQRSNDSWTITDLDSTNGTEVSGEKIYGTVPLVAFVPVKIGTTTFELRP